MRVLPTGFCSFIIAALLAVFANVAQSSELLVMPFSCSVIDGEPVLRPSDDHGYKILGGRKQQDFTACSPSRSSHCRKMTIHRFNVKCGGRTVTWASLVAASNGHRRAWLEDDQLVIQMPWTWTLDPDDPCAQPDRSGRRRFGRRARFCEHRRANAPRPLLRLPAGFAPTFGIDAIFVNEKTAPATVTASKPKSDTPKPQAPEAKEKAKETHAVLPPTPPKQSKVSKQKAPDSVISPPKQPTAPKQADKKQKTSPPKVAAAQTAPDKPGLTIGPNSLTIINSAAIPPKAAPAPTPQPQKPTTSEKETVKLIVTGTKVPKPSNIPTEQAAISNNEQTAGVLAKALNNPMALILTALTVLGIALMTGWAIIHRQNSSTASTISRDIASVSIREAQDPTQTQKRDVALTSNHNQKPSDKQQSQQQTPAPPKPNKFGDDIPKTRKESFDVLGMSVTSNASTTVIKKVVDGLRLSWHPDHAADEADRKIRETRLKQINAAWEIISGQREEEPEPTPLVPTEEYEESGQTPETVT